MKTEIEILCEEYIKYEILEDEHYACEREKQAKYCTNQINYIFNVIEKIAKTKDRAYDAINGYSELHFDRIQKQILGLAKGA